MEFSRHEHKPIEAIGSHKGSNTHNVLTFPPQHLKPRKQLSHETELYVTHTRGIRQSPQIPTRVPWSCINQTNQKKPPPVPYFQRSGEEPSTNGKNLFSLNTVVPSLQVSVLTKGPRFLCALEQQQSRTASPLVFDFLINRIFIAICITYMLVINLRLFHTLKSQPIIQDISTSPYSPQRVESKAWKYSSYCHKKSNKVHSCFLSEQSTAPL